MGRKIQVNQDNVIIGGREYDSGAEVVISDAEFASIPAKFLDSTPNTPTKMLSDLGASAHDEGDAVTTQSPAPDAPAALTAEAAAGETPTKAEYDALLADVTALHEVVGDLLEALTGEGKPFSA